MTAKLKESTGGLGKVTGKTRWESRIIAVGPGSSGVHTEEALRNTGPAAWPEGTKVNIDHQSWEDYLSQPAGTLQTLAGVVASTPVFKSESEAEDGIAGLYAEVQVSDAWAPFVEQFAPYIGLSITSDYWGDEVNEAGLPIVEGYVPSVLNTVDLVTEPGAKGRLLKAIESYKESHSEYGKIIPKASVADATDSRKVDGMTPEQIAELKEALVTAVTESVTKLSESLKPVVAEPEVEDEDTVDIAAVTEAVVASGLPAPARTKVYEAVKNGKDVAEAISAEKAYSDSLREAHKTETVVIRGDQTKATESLKIDGWVKA
jgi:hypothetical protein